MTMEVDDTRMDLLNRAIDTVTRATEEDMDGRYEEAVTLYDSALRDLNDVIRFEKSQVVMDVVMPKLNAYQERSATLKKFLSRSRTPSSDAGSVGGADVTVTSASSDSGVDTVEGDDVNSHNLSTDSAAQGEPTYSTVYELRDHQKVSRQRFLRACEEQVEELLKIIKDESEPDEIRDRARDRCLQILDFAEAYKRDFVQTSERAVHTKPAVAAASGPERMERTVSVASSVAPAEPQQLNQLVTAEVLRSAEDQCPDPPHDGDAEFGALHYSLDNLRLVNAPAERGFVRPDSPDYAIVRRATPSPRKQLSQTSLNRIEPDCEPLLRAADSPAVTSGAEPQHKGWRRAKHASKSEPDEEKLANPGLFWILLGSICG